MNCPQCQQPVADGARFCSRCGSSITLADLPETVIAPAPRDPLIGRVLETKYEILSHLGAGGMGAVYRARRVRIGDEVAVKVLHQDYVKDTAALERFRREARAAARLQHPNVVAIYDYGEAGADDAPAFIVMELVRGQSLRKILDREGKLAPIRALALMRSICAGVGAAHRNDIVHRDLKPDNIIVQPPDVEGEPETAKVLDFGIAKIRDLASSHTLTQTGTVIGTPYYMSPEQCRADPLDARSDVYSLGAMMYEMLVGRPPFTAANFTGVVAKHLTEPPPPMPAEAGIPPALEQAVTRALAKDPAARQSDALAFARELQTALGAPGTQPMGSFGTAPQDAQATRPTSFADLQPTVPQRPQHATAPALPPGTTPAPRPTEAAAPAAYPHTPTAPARGARSMVFAAGGAVAILALIAGGAVLWFMTRQPVAPGEEPSNRNAPVVVANQNAPVVVSGGVSPLPETQTVNANVNMPPLNVNRPPVNANASGATPDAGPPAAEPDAEESTSSAGDDEVPSGNVPAALRRAEAKILANQRLSESDLAGLPLLHLRMLRNTVYARHGRPFQRPPIRRYFSTRPWYRPRPDYSDADLTPVDRANIQLILAAERQAG